MKPVQRSEIVDHVTYAEQRDTLRAEALAIKAPRRVLVGEHLTFLFENRDTVRYQVQEMMRTEQIVREADIQHELDTYNELLGGDGELGCTLLIGIEDEAERAVKLEEWRALPEHVYAKLPDGTRVRPTFDPRQVGEERLSSVQYLKFPVGPEAPVALGVDLPGFVDEIELRADQRTALQEDLDATPT
jgi:hypothetical protein